MKICMQVHVQCINTYKVKKNAVGNARPPAAARRGRQIGIRTHYFSYALYDTVHRRKELRESGGLKETKDYDINHEEIMKN